MEAKLEGFKPLSKVSRPKIYQKGELLYQQGFRQTSVFFLLNGAVSLRRTYPDGCEHIHTFLWPGDMFGSVDGCLLSEDTALSLTEITVIKISRKNFLTDVEQIPNYGWEMVLQLSKHRQQLLQHVTEIKSAVTVDQKIAYFLLYLMQKTSYTKRNSTYVNIPMKYNEVANYLSIHYETLSRSLKRLQDNHIIEKQGLGLIKITDTNKLREIRSKKHLYRV